MAGAIGDKIKHLREERGLTMTAVAERLEISLSGYQKYENNSRDVSTEMLNKLADFFHVSTDYLLGRDSKRPDPIEMLDAEEAEKRLLKAYFQLRPGLRAEFLQSIADALARQEGIEINAETYTAGEIEDFQAEEASAKDDAG